MKHTELSWQNTQGLNIFAQEWRPDGPPKAVIGLVHGLGEHSSRYEHVAQAVSQAGYALIGMDLPGHGRSGGKRGCTSFDDIVVEIDYLLDEIRGRFPGCPAFLYGHSMGGVMVLYYTLKRQPDLHGVISTSPGLAPGEPVPAIKRTLARLLYRIAPDFTLENGLDQNNLSRDPALVEAYRQDPLVHPRISARLGWDILSRGEWIIENAVNFPLPLLLAIGTADHIVSRQATQKFVERVPPEKLTFKAWKGLVHETHNEPEKQQVIEYLLNWIACQLAP